MVQAVAYELRRLRRMVEAACCASEDGFGLAGMLGQRVDYVLEHADEIPDIMTGALIPSPPSDQILIVLDRILTRSGMRP